jgi:hypothetical protein
MTDWDAILDVLQYHDKDSTPMYAFPTPTGGEGVLIGTWSLWPPRKTRRTVTTVPTSWRDLGWIADD